ncbi:hypothetical protein LXA43DRAFT_992789 [Ganoderma leucocontextum]|nr:hypothetical protein LXA43DRAFT_992789 [Ganoderma leucocontextum]
MVILDEKTQTLMLPPPPPYLELVLPALTLVTLPPHILLRIVYETFAQGHVEKQRKVLYWLTMSLRLVNRALYMGESPSSVMGTSKGRYTGSRDKLAFEAVVCGCEHFGPTSPFLWNLSCMHILRSTYLPLFSSLIRSPYTSDPFPHAASSSSSYSHSSSSSPPGDAQREMRVLDLFIVLKVREDVWTDDSELHLEREESFKDLFDLLQPRARLEDLVHLYGTRDGAIAVPLSSGLTPVATSPVSSSFSSSSKKGSGAKDSYGYGYGAGSSKSGSRRSVAPLPFFALAASFSPRAVGLVLTTRERKRKIVEVPRARDETLEVSAKKLVRELKGWLASNPNHGVR